LGIETKVKKQTVSAVIMTKNCEDLVEGTLKSVADWVDEIVVLDGFSTDKTVEICRRYTDKVFQNRWDGYRFCTERNLGTDHASSDWCFHVDPDERATPAFRDAVLKILKNGTRHCAFEFRKKNFFLGHWMRHGGWYHYSLHFFKRGKARYEGVIHESLKVDGTIGKIEAPVEHYPFVSIKQFVNRHNGYSTREAQALREERGIVDEKEVLFELKKKPIKRFFKFYIRKKGFLDGIHGLIFSVLFAWVHFINWAKYWEINENFDHQTRGDGRRFAHHALADGS
jgi:glycosyltransferase involved in cell wall biosynthesis